MIRSTPYLKKTGSKLQEKEGLRILLKLSGEEGGKVQSLFSACYKFVFNFCQVIASTSLTLLLDLRTLAAIS